MHQVRQIQRQRLIKNSRFGALPVITDKLSKHLRWLDFDRQQEPYTWGHFKSEEFFGFNWLGFASSSHQPHGFKSFVRDWEPCHQKAFKGEAMAYRSYYQSGSRYHIYKINPAVQQLAVPILAPGPHLSNIYTHRTLKRQCSRLLCTTSAISLLRNGLVIHLI